MEQITTTSTLKKIQKLIENNDGDTGRLNHIIDFINNEKPLYKTDKIYLENKLNSKIIIQTKEIIPNNKDILKQIRKLIEVRRGDPGRLEYISTALENEQKLYKSDKQYLENNFGIIIIEQENKETDTKKHEILEEELKVHRIRELSSKNQNIEFKKEEKINLQKVELDELVITRKNNEKELVKERERLEEKIKDERNLILKQTKITEEVNLQKVELVKIQDERSSILKNIELQKNSITKELFIQKKQLIDVQKEHKKIELQFFPFL